MSTDDTITRKPEDQAKPRLILLEAGPKLTLERVVAFGRKFLGREPTPEELDDMKKRLAYLPPR